MFDTMDVPQWVEDLDEGERRERVVDCDRRIGERMAHINAALAELLTDVGEFVELGGWADHSAKSPQDWVAWRLGVTPYKARQHIRIAQRLSTLPQIKASFERGELSYWQIRALVPIATTEIEASLLNIARYSTAAQLQRIVRAYKGCLDRAELEAGNQRHIGRSVDYFFDEDGFLIVRGRLTPEDGAVLMTALERAEDQLRGTETPEDGETEFGPEQRRADALTQVARDSLSVRDATRSMPRPEVVIHVDVDSLVDGSGERCELQEGPALASETARRICCDATVQEVIERGGKVLDVGRKHRTVPPRLRRALEQRDRTCRFPGCDRRRFNQAHHVVHWVRGGETKAANLMLLCFRHHRLVHEGGVSIVGNPDGDIDFLRADGSVVPRTAGVAGGAPQVLIEEHRKKRLRIELYTCTTLWDGYPPELDRCVDALLDAGGYLTDNTPRGP